MYRSEHVYVTWGGTLASGLEEWQCGLRLAPSVDVTFGEGAQLAGLSDLAARISTFHSSPGAQIHSTCKLTWVKQAILDRDGRYKVGPGIHEFTTPVDGSATGSAAIHPTQVAAVASLRTGTSFGDAQRGRIYIPQPYMGVGFDGLVLQSDADNLAVAVATLIGSINTLKGGGELGVKVNVMSSKGEGTSREVTHVLVGRVLDTQRRRRAKLQESYVTRAVPS